MVRQRGVAIECYGREPLLLRSAASLQCLAAVDALES
jgi:hypothetical protein